MNLVDLFLLGVLLYAAVRGFRQGGLSQVAAFGGAAVGLVVGAVAAPQLAGLLEDQPGPMLSLLTLGLLLILISIGQGIGVGIGLRLRTAADVAGAAPIDRTAGIVVGAIGVLLTVWVLGGVLVRGPSAQLAQEMRESRIVSAVDEALPPPPDIFSRVGQYLNQQGFPEVFAGLGGGVLAPPVPPPGQGAVAAAAAAGTPSTVQVRAIGCGGVSTGSGFVTRPGYVVTNAHVVAGGDALSVRDTAGEHAASAVHYDPDLDLAVLAAPGVSAPPISWVGAPTTRGAQGATLGYPGGQRQLVVKAAAVRARTRATGRNVYGRGLVEREILIVTAPVVQGDSGGPFVTSDGRVGGVVFGAAVTQAGTGYALTAEQARPPVDAAIARATPTGTGGCRF